MHHSAWPKFFSSFHLFPLSLLPEMLGLNPGPATCKNVFPTELHPQSFFPDPSCFLKRLLLLLSLQSVPQSIVYPWTTRSLVLFRRWSQSLFNGKYLRLPHVNSLWTFFFTVKYYIRPLSPSSFLPFSLPVSQSATFCTKSSSFHLYFVILISCFF